MEEEEQTDPRKKPKIEIVHVRWKMNLEFLVEHDFRNTAGWMPTNLGQIYR